MGFPCSLNKASVESPLEATGWAWQEGLQSIKNWMGHPSVTLYTQVLGVPSVDPAGDFLDLELLLTFSMCALQASGSIPWAASSWRNHALLAFLCRPMALLFSVTFNTFHWRNIWGCGKKICPHNQSPVFFASDSAPKKCVPGNFIFMPFLGWWKRDPFKRLLVTSQ